MQGTSLAGHSILIVEYDVLIALDIQMAFEKAGASVVTVYSLPEAFPHLQQDGLSGAVLDYGLRSEDGDALCERLKQRDIPFIFHSGYGRTSDTHHGGIVIRNRPILKFWSRPCCGLWLTKINHPNKAQPRPYCELLAPNFDDSGRSLRHGLGIRCPQLRRPSG